MIMNKDFIMNALKNSFHVIIVVVDDSIKLRDGIRSGDYIQAGNYILNTCYFFLNIQDKTFDVYGYLKFKLML